MAREWTCDRGRGHYRGGEGDVVWGGGGDVVKEGGGDVVEGGDVVT